MSSQNANAASTSTKTSALTTRTATKVDISWPDTISSIVNRRHLRCVQQTPESARKLHETVGFFSDGQALSYDVETTLFEAFCNDDFEGKLHLTTIHQDDTEPPIGLVFWREVPEDEMREWIDYEKLVELARRRRINGKQKMLLSDSAASEKDDAVTTRAGDEILRVENEQTGINPTEQALVAVRNESLTALSAPSQVLANKQRVLVPDSVVKAWIKIELLAVRPPWWGRRIGTMLLACAMQEAWKRNNSRVVLHVAGGTANVPAVRLYERFGFVPAPGIFHKPDKDMFVLGNIGLALQSLLWSETLEVPPDRLIQ